MTIPVKQPLILLLFAAFRPTFGAPAAENQIFHAKIAAMAGAAFYRNR